MAELTATNFGVVEEPMSYKGTMTRVAGGVRAAGAPAEHATQ